MKIQIAHLYPEILNLYGDRGNIASMVYRLAKRGIECEVIEYDIGDDIDFENTDIIYIGGGTDKDHNAVCEELLRYKEEFKEYVDKGGVMLSVCGGFEILGKYYVADGEKIQCLDILDMYTVYGNERHIGNIVIKSDLTGGEIVGFENHSGVIKGEGINPLGKVVSGFGNDGLGYEGAIFKNVVATYLHGPLLPKNPVLTDYILSKALKRKYGTCTLEPLDDTVENMAHDYAVKRFS